MIDKIKLLVHSEITLSPLSVFFDLYDFKNTFVKVGKDNDFKILFLDKKTLCGFLLYVSYGTNKYRMDFFFTESESLNFFNQLDVMNLKNVRYQEIFSEYPETINDVKLLVLRLIYILSHEVNVKNGFLKNEVVYNKLEYTDFYDNRIQQEMDIRSKTILPWNKNKIQYSETKITPLIKNFGVIVEKLTTI